MRTSRFYKENDTWFIDLKYWPFSKAYLAMVMGADVLLEKLAEGKNEVTIQYSNKGIIDYQGILQRSYIVPGSFFNSNGAVYELKYMKMDYSCDNQKKDTLWLCNVTRFIFLCYPKDIFFKVKNEI